MEVFSPTDSIDRPVTPESMRSNDWTDAFPTVAPNVLGLPLVALPEMVSQSSTPPDGIDFDFELIWPDSEDLLQSMLYTDGTSQLQMPLGTLPFSATPSSIDTTFDTPSSFDVRPSSIGTIPFGANQQAVQDVSKMVSSVVSRVSSCHFC